MEEEPNVQSPVSAVTSIVAAAGALIVVASFAFSQAAADWIAFGPSVIALSGSAACLVAEPRSEASPYRAIAAVTGLLAAFTLIVSLGVFTGGAQHWVVFGGGVAALVLSFLARERYVASFVESRVSDTESDARGPLRSAA
jgi:hypothetical protein